MSSKSQTTFALLLLLTAACEGRSGKKVSSEPEAACAGGAARVDGQCTTTPQERGTADAQTGETYTPGGATGQSTGDDSFYGSDLGTDGTGTDLGTDGAGSDLGTDGTGTDLGTDGSGTDDTGLGSGLGSGTGSGSSYNNGNLGGSYSSGYKPGSTYNSGTSGNYNSGDYNSGNYNSGDYNSGTYNKPNYNSGNYNSGNYNSGNYNSGNYNSGNYNSGNYNSGNYNSGNYNNPNYNTNPNNLPPAREGERTIFPNASPKRRVDGVPHIKIATVIRDRRLQVLASFSHTESVRNVTYTYGREKFPARGSLDATTGIYTARDFGVPITVRFDFDGRDCRVKVMATFLEATLTPTCG